MASLPASSPAAASELISFSQGGSDLLDPLWNALSAVDAAGGDLSVLSGHVSWVGIEKFAKCHWQMLNELQGTDPDK